MRSGLDTALGRARSLLSSCPCEYAEIRLSASTGTSISLSGEQVETFSSGDTIGGSVRVLNNGAWGFISFNDPGGIEGYFRRGLEISSSLALKEKSRIRRSEAVRRNFTTPMAKDFTRVPLEEKFNLISAYNKILRSSPKIQTTRALYRDVTSYYVYLNSEGSELAYDRAYCGVQLSSVARDGKIIQPYGESVSGYGGYEITEGREELAESVVKTAVDLLAAESVPGGTYRVVTDQKLAGVFIHEAFGHLSEADFVHENERLRKMMVIGKEFGPPELTVIDSGVMPEHSGYIPFDDEGIIPARTPLIRNGRLSGRLHSRETAEKMGEETTGNGRAIGVMKQPIVRMTNTYIENGPHSREAILDAAGDGIYAAGMIGGETNLEMFTFTSAFGHEIRNGKIGKMYRDIVLSGNVFTTLRNITMIGNDLRMYGGLGGCGKGGQSPLPVSFGGPHLLIKDVLIGGAQ
ncbi:MAG TPA: TldD/PmbA family protein [Spirochaetota bacterium]|nr:TldD/PmbA family protein [Spirochaetota bacterium]HPV42900.1 TldD/PmbA family protein [Spirochaetota bacterium]